MFCLDGTAHTENSTGITQTMDDIQGSLSLVKHHRGSDQIFSICQSIHTDRSKEWKGVHNLQLSIFKFIIFILMLNIVDSWK